MAIGTLSIDIEAKLAKLEQGLEAAVLANQRAAKSVDSAWLSASSGIRSSLQAAAAAFSVGAFTTFSRNLLDGVDKLNDLSDATGSTVENISALEDVARRTGASMDTVGDILVKFNKGLSDAKEDNDVGRALKAIGVSAKELRDLDPSEALRRTAVALAGYADDGNKARLVQELFGKSVREAAPFLKDLADAGQLNATITSEQAKQAERFNQQLASLSKNSEDAARALLGGLLPALNEYLLLITKLKQGPGLAASVLEVFKGNTFGTTQQALESYNQQIAAIDEKIAKLDRSNGQAGGLYGAALRKELEESKAKLQQFAKVYQEVRDATNANSGLANAAGANSIGSFGQKKLPALADLVPPKAELDEKRRSFMDYAMTVSQSLGQLADDTPTVKLARLNDQLAALDKLATAGLDPRIVTEMRTALQGLATAEVPVDKLQRFAELQALIASTPTGQLERILALEEELASAGVANAGGAEKYAAALAALEEQFDRLSPVVEETLDSMEVFAKQFRTDIEDSLGNGLVRTLTGDFDNLGDLWGNMLKRMAASALEVDLKNKLFGRNDGGGFADLVKGFSSIFGLAEGGAFSKGVQFYAAGDVFGSPTLFGHAGGLGVLGEAGPEAVMPLSRGTDGKLGVKAQGAAAAPTYININVGQGVSEQQLLMVTRAMRDQAVAMSKGQIFMSMNRGGSFAR